MLKGFGQASSHGTLCSGRDWKPKGNGIIALFFTSNEIRLPFETKNPYKKEIRRLSLIEEAMSPPPPPTTTTASIRCTRHSRLPLQAQWSQTEIKIYCFRLYRKLPDMKNIAVCFSSMPFWRLQARHYSVNEALLLTEWQLWFCILETLLR